MVWHFLELGSGSTETINSNFHSDSWNLLKLLKLVRELTVNFALKYLFTNIYTHLNISCTGSQVKKADFVSWSGMFGLIKTLLFHEERIAAD